MIGDSLSQQLLPPPSDGVVNGATLVMIYDLERRMSEKIGLNTESMNKVLDGKLSYKHFTLILGLIMTLLSAQLYAILDNQKEMQREFITTRETLIQVKTSQQNIQKTLTEFTLVPSKK